MRIPLKIFPGPPTAPGFSLVLSWERPADLPSDYAVTLLEGYNNEWRAVSKDWYTLSQEENEILYNPPHVPQRSADLKFRVVLTGNGKRHDTPEVGLFNVLAPHEFRTVRTILSHEMTDMRGGNGHAVLLAKRKEYGEPADSYDEATGQILNPGSDLSGYGERYKGGFSTPIPTRVRFLQTQEQEVSGTGVGSHAKRIITARMFSFPSASPGDLLIDEETGLRYTVLDNKVPYLFRGVFPVMEDVTLEELPRSHIRYSYDPKDAE